MPELNPVTRTRLWYIAIFLAFDAIVALLVSSYVKPNDPLALPSILFGLVMAVGAIALGSFLYATREKPVELRASRDRM